MSKIVLIRFQDLCHSPGWTPRNDIPLGDDLDCIAVGFLIQEDDKYITIAQATSKCECDDEVLNPFTIPKVNIKETEVITDG